jgi:hypothetical protein
MKQRLIVLRLIERPPTANEAGALGRSEARRRENVRHREQPFVRRTIVGSRLGDSATPGEASSESARASAP